MIILVFNIIPVLGIFMERHFLSHLGGKYTIVGRQRGVGVSDWKRATSEAAAADDCRLRQIELHKGSFLIG